MSIDVLEFTEILLRAFLISSLFLMTILYLNKVKEARRSGIELSPFIGVTIMFFFFGLGNFFFVYHRYFNLELGLDVFILYKGAILANSAALIGLVFFSEKMIGKTKFGFTLFNLICCIYGLIFLHTTEALRIFYMFSYPISFPFIFIAFFYSLIWKTKERIRLKLGISFLCGIFFFIFFILSSETIQAVLSLPQDFTMILSFSGSIVVIIIWGLTFSSFETLTELDWQEKLKELFIIAPNGATLLHHSFVAETTVQSADLISSGLIGVKDILAEMMQSEQRLATVDHQDVKILFEYGIYSTLALVVYENLHIHRSKLTSLNTQFETLFQDILAHWNGEVEIFLPAKQLIEKIFTSGK